MLSQISETVVRTWVEINIIIQNNMFGVLPPAKMYDINVFLEDWMDNILLGFEDWTSLIWFSYLDDIMLLLDPCRDDIKRESVLLLFILLVSISFSIWVISEDPCKFAKSKLEVFRLL